MTFDEVIMKVDKLLWKIANKYSIKGNKVEDNYQELLMKTFEVYKDYNGDYALTTYLKTILDNHMLNLCKKDNQQKRINNIKGNNVKDIKGYDFNRLVINNVKYSRPQELILSEAYTLLEKEPKKDLLLRLIKGETQIDVANELGVSKQYINKQYLDFIKKVRVKCDIK